jgi:penicillin-binding protein 2
MSRRPLAPVVKNTVVISEAVRRPIIDGLAGATIQESGTAHDAFVGFPLERFPIGGKTGTAQVGTKKSDNALFAAFGPIANPRFVVVVVLEEAGFGGQAAAPVARRIFERLVGLPVGPVVRPGAPRND